jgi:hypothetical protein
MEANGRIISAMRGWLQLAIIVAAQLGSTYLALTKIGSRFRLGSNLEAKLSQMEAEMAEAKRRFRLSEQ